MNLKERVKPIIQAMVSAKHQTMASVHLSDNCLDMKTKEYVIRKMGVNTGNYAKLNEYKEMDPFELTLLQQSFKKSDYIKQHIHKFFD